MEEYTIKGTILTFNDTFNEPLDKYYKLLSNPEIDTIIFGLKFNQEIDHVIPTNIKVIKFEWFSKFNKNINFLPESIKEIEYNYKKNHSLEELQNLPKSLLKLHLGGIFNQQITKNILPNSLTHLTFRSFFNQHIIENVLPGSLTHLIFGYNFNQKITENVLPNNLTHLRFGTKFNQEITENVLPNSLTHLIFKDDFNQEIKENVLPDSLTHLTFGRLFKQEITETVLPKSLQVLNIYTYKILKNIDSSKIKFKIGYFC